jgi:hypothetical protein
MSAQVTFSPPVQRVPMGLVPGSWRPVLRGLCQLAGPSGELALAGPVLDCSDAIVTIESLPADRKSFGLNAVHQEAEISGD